MLRNVYGHRVRKKLAGGKASVNRELVQLGLQLRGEMYFHLFNVRETRPFWQCSSLQREMHIDLRYHFDRLAVQQHRPVMPALDRFDRRLRQ